MAELDNMHATGKAKLRLVAMDPHRVMDQSKPHLAVVSEDETFRKQIDQLHFGNHNIAKDRYDIWFTDNKGKQWYGVQLGSGDNVCHCRRVKELKPLLVEIRKTDLQWDGEGWNENGACVTTKRIRMKENITDIGAAKLIMQALGVRGFRKDQWCQSDFGPWRLGCTGIYADIVTE